ncbi:xanthine dehydrogenase family protein molybdopterin-binding subunit [Myxococcota bacterium]|nr:xanthine dehydrogenase family protein molybdopterin-binding subunit [Myxococcota bacterium]MBU1380627.1 xanthine dehydrogenase family protein molybdopterin-binding subunit [Myxococcota bacterium]MBU1496970.1 xanthine dehydrogenase family protein molybdopterin-binding subunit [Myxococcota bacterium]
MKNKGLDSGLPRPDAVAKACGKSVYLPDLKFPGMLHAVVVSSPVASGVIKKIDISEALKVSGVKAILTAENAGINNKIGMIYDDQSLLAEDKVRMVGDRLALIAATSLEAAMEARDRMVIEIDEMPGVYDIRTALNDGSPKVHESGNLFKEFFVKRGDFEDAVVKADVVIEDDYTIGGQEHAYLETQGTVAFPVHDGSYRIYSSTQCPFYVRFRVARMLGIPHNMIRVIQTVTGGAFGGKEDYPDEPAMCAAALCKATGKPVRLVLPRVYDMQCSTKRHSMAIKHKLYATKGGKILGVKAEILVDAGAYAGLSTIVAERANTSAVGPYSIGAVDVHTKVIYTNNLFGGPYRGFGAPQVGAVHESQIDRLAMTVGIDPIKIREMNGLSRENPVFSSGEVLPQAHIYQDMLKLMKEKSNWDDHYNAKGKVDGYWREGIGLGTTIYGVNLHWGGSRLDRGASLVSILNDGSVSLAVGVTEMGQGNLAAMRTICANAFGISEELIRIEEVDTALVPDSGPTVASRSVMSGGNAVIDGVKQLNERLCSVAAKILKVESDTVICRNGQFISPKTEETTPWKKVVEMLYLKKINPSAIGWYRSEDRIYDPETGQGRAYAFYSFGGHVVRLRVDTQTGAIDVLETTAVHDVGQIINLVGIEGQVQGGTVQGLGWAIMEDFRMHKGKMLNAGFTDYSIPSSMDVPAVMNMAFIEEPEPQGPFGAKGIGEPSFISVGAAVLNAVSNALGRDISVLPLTPEKVIEIITEKH